DRARAEEIRAQREAEIITQSVFGRAATATFAEACHSYLKTGGRDGNGGDGRFMTAALDHFGTAPLAKIGLAEIEAFAIKVYPRASAATRDRQAFTPVVAVLRHAAKRQMCTMPIIERPKHKRPVPRWISLKDANRLIDAASDHMRPLIIFLLYTGARAGE